MSLEIPLEGQGRTMSLLKDKKILLTGVLSNRSIAYGIAKACHREGAQLAFTYQNERFLDRITGFAKEFDSEIVLPLDVADDAQIFALAETQDNMGRLRRCGSLYRFRSARSHSRRLLGGLISGCLQDGSGHFRLFFPGTDQSACSSNGGSPFIGADAHLFRQ